MVTVLGVGGEDPVHDHEQVAVDGVGELGHRLDRCGQRLERRIGHHWQHTRLQRLVVIELEELGVVGELSVIRVGVLVRRHTFPLVEHDVEDGICSRQTVDHDQAPRGCRVVAGHDVAVGVVQLPLDLRVGEDVFACRHHTGRLAHAGVELSQRVELIGLGWCTRHPRPLDGQEDPLDQGLGVGLERELEQRPVVEERRRVGRDLRRIVEPGLATDPEQDVGQQGGMEHLFGGDALDELGGLAGLIGQGVHGIQVGRKHHHLDGDGCCEVLPEVVDVLDRHRSRPRIRCSGANRHTAACWPNPHIDKGRPGDELPSARRRPG